MAGIVIGEADVKVGADTSSTAGDIKKGLAGSLSELSQFSNESGKQGQTAGDSFGKRFASYVGPPMGLKSLLAGGIMAGLSALPALMAGVGVLGGIGFGAMFLAKTNSSVQEAGQDVLANLDGVMEKATASLITPIIGAIKQFGGFVQTLEPQLQALFSGVAPYIQPLLDGLEKLVGGLLPGLVSIIRAASPAVAAIAGLFAGLGSALGGMLTAMAPAVKDSAAVLSILGGLLNSLLPIIGKLAASLAESLGPVLVAFGQAIIALEPGITIIVKIMSEFAGAVLTSLSEALTAIGQLLVGIAPSFTALAKVLALVFNALENTGVFGVLEDALEELAAPLATLINALVKSLMPVLPAVIQLFVQFSAILSTLVADGLVALVTGITAIVTKLPFLAPLILAIVAGVKLWAAVQGLLDIALSANPIGILVIAIAALIIVVVEVVQHWQTLLSVLSAVWSAITSGISTAWNKISSLTSKVWNAIYSFIKQWWSVLLGFLTGPFGLLLALFVKFHAQIFAAVEAAWNKILAFVKSILTGISNTITSGLDAARSIITSVGNTIVSIMESVWTRARSAVTSGISGIISLVESLPGRIVSALGDVGSLLFNSGAKIIDGLVSGITSRISAAANAIGSVVSTIKSYLPFSPAKTGPFSGSGDPSNSGVSIATKIASGLTAGTTLVTNAMKGLTSKAAAVAANVSLPSAGLGQIGSVSAASSAMAPGSADYSTAVQQGAYAGVLAAMQQGGSQGASIVINASTAAASTAAGIAQSLRSLSELGIV